jgi:tetratricopeptide (TPR) repeat protein
MKNIYIALSFVIASACSGLIAQTKDSKNADKSFKSFEYVKAAEQYLKLTSANSKADPYIYKQLGECYYNMFNTAEAIKWFAKAVETPQSAETHYKYSQMLKASGNSDEANVQMKNFAAKAPTDARAIAFLANPNYLTKLNTLDKNFEVKKLEINSDQSDFGAVLNNNTLYFASARNMARKTYGWIAEPYLDIYTANQNTDGTFAKPTTIESLNSKFHDGPVSISKDGNTMFFASESYNQNSFEKDKLACTKLLNLVMFGVMLRLCLLTVKLIRLRTLV